MKQYIIVRENLSPSQMMVQVAHAATVGENRRIGTGAPGPSTRPLVVLAVQNRFQLWALLQLFRMVSPHVHPFHESRPLGLTAFSVFAYEGDHRWIFDRLKLANPCRNQTNK